MKNTASQTQGLLLIHLSMTQQYAIATLKIQEIVPYTHLTTFPQPHPKVLGAATLRGQTIAVIDLASAVGFRPISEEELSSSSIIVTEFSRQTLGFLVRKIDKIAPCDWKDITPPPASLGHHTYTTGITTIEDRLVQLIDLELLLSEIFPDPNQNNHPYITDFQREQLNEAKILLVDDSSVARRQLCDALDFCGISYQVTTNGPDAYKLMKQAAETQQAIKILVSDIEMPGIDGYELTFDIRNNPALANSYIILHTSLSSEISLDRANQVGADEALTKFDASDLMDAMLRGTETKV